MKHTFLPDRVRHASPRLPCPWSHSWLVVAFATASAAVAQVPTPTLKSVVTTPTLVTGGDFEAMAPGTYAYAPTWAPWMMTPFTVGPNGVQGSGIAADGATLLAQSDAAPVNDCVMFVEGLGTSSCNVSLTRGLWRVRFLAAQRGQGVPAVPDVQRLRVSFAGTTVFEQQFTSTQFTEFVTAPIRMATSGSVALAFTGLVAPAGNNIALIDSIRIEPVLDWNVKTSWRDSANAVPAAPPGPTDHVLVVPGSTVALTGISGAKTVEVQGHLIAEAVNCSLASEWLLVHTSGARFDIGTADLPFANDFVLTLRGQPAAPPIGMAGSKFLVAMDGGRIEMHGLPKTSWSRLTLLSGSTIRVTDRAGWQVGDQILLVGTATMSQDPFEPDPVSEVCTITAINAGTGDVTLSPAPAGSHCTVAPIPYWSPAGQAWTIDERAEVGMLSHNVRVEGDTNDSTPANGFGAHVMMMNGACCGSPGTGCFSHVQFRRMGQRKVLGRYPLHWHMQLAAGNGQYARGCSVWQSFNRALTIHGTDYLVVEDNVLFDHEGHGLFFEDGGEQHNTIARNLVVLTGRPPDGQEMLPHDNSLNEVQNRTPAAFWISNPNNYFTGNVAADTVGTGYWFAVHQHPTGASYGNPYFNLPSGAPMDPTQLPLGSFDDNTAHSCMSALDVNDTVDDNDTPSNPLDDDILRNVSWDPPGGAVINRFTAYACSMGIYAGLGTDNTFTDLVTFEDAVLADNEIHIQLACAFDVTQSLVVENTGSGVFQPTGQARPPFPGWFPPPGYVYMAYDGPGQLTNSHIVGFDGISGHAYAALVSNSVAARRHTNHELLNLTYAATGAPSVTGVDFSAAPALSEPMHWGLAVRGLSSELSGGLHTDRTLISNHPMMHLANGASTPDYAVPSGTNAWLSPYNWACLYLTHWVRQSPTPNRWTLLSGTSLPTTNFTRQVFQGWPSASFDSVGDAFDVRQMPIIARLAADTHGAVCNYTINTQHPANGTYANRLDLVVDDIAAGDVARMLLSNQPAWNNPSVYVNDTNSPDPAAWSMLTPVGVAALDSQTVTAFARPSPSEVLLRTVNTNRRHQLTITW